MKSLKKIIMAAGLAAAVSGGPVLAAGGAEPHGPEGGWPWQGIFGTYDKAALQRGWAVYDQVCAACHSLRLVAYRNLAEIGFSEAEIKAIAAGKEVNDGPNDEGEMFTRKGLASDRFVKPFPNEQAAKSANGGALPPDLSLIVKAKEGHADYIYSVLTGYGKTPPADMKLPSGMNYNPMFPGGQIAMAPPLSEGALEFADGTKATVGQMAKDVTSFLQWAAEPELERRKQMGVKVMIFLLIMTVLFWFAKRRIWADLH